MKEKKKGEPRQKGRVHRVCAAARVQGGPRATLGTQRFSFLGAHVWPAEHYEWARWGEGLSEPSWAQCSLMGLPPRPMPEFTTLSPTRERWSHCSKLCLLRGDFEPGHRNLIHNAKFLMCRKRWKKALHRCIVINRKHIFWLNRPLTQPRPKCFIYEARVVRQLSRWPLNTARSYWYFC